MSTVKAAGYTRGTVAFHWIVAALILFNLGFGLYTVLPTLPDPYAANVRGLFFARLRQVQGVTQLLVAAVVWQKAPQDDAADTITTSFAFAPIGAQAESVAAWTIAAANRAAAGMQQHIVGAGVQAAPPAAADLRAFMATRRTPPEDIWDSLFQQFGQEQFSLLDVSSNADQMGVSFAFFDPRRLEKGQSPFGEAFGGGPPAPASSPRAVGRRARRGECRRIRRPGRCAG